MLFCFGRHLILWFKVARSRVMMLSMSSVRMEVWTIETFIPQHLLTFDADILNLPILCSTAIHLGSIKARLLSCQQ